MQVGETGPSKNLPPASATMLAEQLAELRYSVRPSQPDLDGGDGGFSTLNLRVAAFDADGQLLGSFNLGGFISGGFNIRRHDKELFRLAQEHLAPLTATLGSIFTFYQQE